MTDETEWDELPVNLAPNEFLQQASEEWQQRQRELAGDIERFTADGCGGQANASPVDTLKRHQLREAPFEDVRRYFTALEAYIDALDRYRTDQPMFADYCNGHPELWELSELFLQQGWKRALTRLQETTELAPLGTHAVRAGYAGWVDFIEGMVIGLEAAQRHHQADLEALTAAHRQEIEDQINTAPGATGAKSESKSLEESE